MASRAWGELSRKNPVVGFVDICLRGAGQVFFQNNPLTGFVMLAAIFWGGFASGNRSVAYGAVIGLVVASGTAILLNVDRGALQQGLFGFNGVLVGGFRHTPIRHRILDVERGPATYETKLPRCPGNPVRSELERGQTLR